METLLLSAGRQEDVETAAALLRKGGLVAFPTETVYGLGARADDRDAIGRLCRVKQRPPGKEFALLIPSPDACALHAAPLEPVAEGLAGRFWPGPLTLVVADGKGGEVGLRGPDCEATARLLGLAGVAVVAPSANVSGEPDSVTAEQVMAVLGGRIDAVLDGGPARLEVPSTVVRVRSGGVEILRAGALSRADIMSAIGR